jgi:hypothetical protein
VRLNLIAAQVLHLLLDLHHEGVGWSKKGRHAYHVIRIPVAWLLEPAVVLTVIRKTAIKAATVITPDDHPSQSSCALS